MVNVENLSKRYGEIVAVDNISFEVEKGDILGFLGPNGAGKTTTMRLLTGYIPPTHGTVRIGEYDMTLDPIQAKTQIGYLPENPPLYFEMTVRAYLEFVADIKGIKAEARSQNVESSMEMCGIANVAGRIIGNLSKGFKQRVGIAQALVHDPALLILDEPTIGLDPKQIIEIRELIKSLAGDRTVILSTHILPEVSMTCSRVIIINEGRIVLEESMSVLDKHDGIPRKITIKLGHHTRVAKEVMESVKGVVSVTEEDLGLYSIRADGTSDVRDELARKVVQKGWDLVELKGVKMTLEDVFLTAITSGVH